MIMSKLLHLYVILGTIFSLGAAPVPAAAFSNSGDGGPVIVLPPDAIPAERTAAQELQAFLEQISGEKPPTQMTGSVWVK